MKTNWIIQSTLTAALLTLLFGCKEEEKYQLRFSHSLHVEDVGAECSDCHGEPGAFQPISHETCLACHDEPAAEEISVDTCGMCHEEKQIPSFELQEGEEMAEPETYAAPEAVSRHIFVHSEALADRCMECHGSLLNEDLETVPALRRDDIVAIRNKAHMSGQDCGTCHADMDPAIPPASHDMAWTKRHGNYFRQDDASCTVCHTQDSCSDCHSVMQPPSHNNMFRTRTHGILAATDRATCQVCHEEDSCTSCHAETQPRSHYNARWAAYGSTPTHCISCHDTSTPGDGCATCHEEGNNVLLHESFWNRGQKIDHNKLPAGTSCYQCHWIITP